MSNKKFKYKSKKTPKFVLVKTMSSEVYATTLNMSLIEQKIKQGFEIEIISKRIIFVKRIKNN